MDIDMYVQAILKKVLVYLAKDIEARVTYAFVEKWVASMW